MRGLEGAGLPQGIRTLESAGGSEPAVSFWPPLRGRLMPGGALAQGHWAVSGRAGARTRVLQLSAWVLSPPVAPGPEVAASEQVTQSLNGAFLGPASLSLHLPSHLFLFQGGLRVPSPGRTREACACVPWVILCVCGVSVRVRVRDGVSVHTLFLTKERPCAICV